MTEKRREMTLWIPRHLFLDILEQRVRVTNIPRGARASQLCYEFYRDAIGVRLTSPDFAEVEPGTEAPALLAAIEAVADAGMDWWGHSTSPIPGFSPLPDASEPSPSVAETLPDGCAGVGPCAPCGKDHGRPAPPASSRVDFMGAVSPADLRVQLEMAQRDIAMHQKLTNLVIGYTPNPFLQSLEPGSLVCGWTVVRNLRPTPSLNGTLEMAPPDGLIATNIAGGSWESPPRTSPVEALREVARRINAATGGLVSNSGNFSPLPADDGQVAEQANGLCVNDRVWTPIDGGAIGTILSIGEYSSRILLRWNGCEVSVFNNDLILVRHDLPLPTRISRDELHGLFAKARCSPSEPSPRCSEDSHPEPCAECKRNCASDCPCLCHVPEPEIFETTLPKGGH